MRRHTGKRRVIDAATAVLTAMLLTGCNGGSGVNVETITPPTSTASSTSISASSSATGSSVSTDSTATDTVTTSSVESTDVTSTTPAQWPTTFNAAQQEAAQQSLAAVHGFINVLREADADPGAKDWTSEVRKYAADPAALQTLAGIQSLVTAKVHATVPTAYENPTVVSADDHRVVVEVCVDSTKTVLVNASGESVLKPSPNPRSIAIYTLALYSPENGGWLVTETTTSSPVRPC